MGSMINLAVGRLEVDWGKNFFFNDHSQLFQASDVAQVPYYYVDWDEACESGYDDKERELITVMKDGLSKPLHQVMERIDLLGYTMNYAQREFERLLESSDFDTAKFSFGQLAKALRTVDINAMSADYGEGESSAKFFRYFLFDKLGLEKIVDDAEYVRVRAGDSMESLSAYTVLRLVAQNPLAQGLPVSWNFADLEEGGWSEREEFVKPVHQENRFLIVTEGSSDSEIIRHALKLLKPHVADFFEFVDMKEGYPFTGTGNLYNFTKGLIGISVQNNVAILYDNDAEGVFNFNRTVKLKVPANMRILKLPDLQKFENFQCIGPSGTHLADINGQAAAVECYLDIGQDAAVRWNNYHKDLGVYHGELVGKRNAMKAFLAQSRMNGCYDFSKIEAILDMIVSECTLLREPARLTELGKRM